MLKKEEITYIEQMTKQIVHALEEILKYDGDYITLPIIYPMLVLK